jgi:hypothetical protein
MKLNLFSSIAFITLILVACNKHEVIPAPEPKAELKSHFIGTINGTEVEFTKNVNGYYGLANKSKIILPSPSSSSAVYYYDMKSDEAISSMKVGLGSVLWDASAASDPSVAMFNSFFNSNLSPSYSTDGANGFVVVYKDGNGSEWTSSEGSVNPQSVQFTNVSQESDNNGDYSKFSCTFSCFVYRSYGNPVVIDSLYIDNGQMTGWFQR